MSRTARTILVYVAVIAIVVMIVNAFVSSATDPEELTFTEFQERQLVGQHYEVYLLVGQCLSGLCLAGIVAISRRIAEVLQRVRPDVQLSGVWRGDPVPGSR